jgi:hypothetical protein
MSGLELKERSLLHLELNGLEESEVFDDKESQ